MGLTMPEVGLNSSRFGSSVLFKLIFLDRTLWPFGMVTGQVSARDAYCLLNTVSMI